MGGVEAKKKKRSLAERFGASCAYCGSTERLTLDHRLPRSCGGSNRLDNLQLLCFDCNQAKADTGAGRTTVLRWRGIPVAA